MLSSGERVDGLGSKWVLLRLPGDREKDSFWNHSVGYATVKAAVQTPVMVYAWNGKKKVRSGLLEIFYNYIRMISCFGEVSLAPVCS